MGGNEIDYCTFRRQIDITTYQIRKIKADTSLCLFADDLFQKNVLVKGKIVSFSCNLNNFVLKNVIVFSCGTRILKLHTFDKKCYF